MYYVSGLGWIGKKRYEELTFTAGKMRRNITWATEAQKEWKHTSRGNTGWEAINGQPSMLLSDTNGVICTLPTGITQNLCGFAHARVKLLTLFSPLLKVWRKVWQMTPWVIQLHRRQFPNAHAKFPAGIFITAQRRLAMFQAFYPNSVKTFRHADQARGHCITT